MKETPPKEEPPPKAEPTFPDLATVNAARAFWETRAHTRRHARQNEIPSRCFATIDNSEDGDVYFLNYFEQHDTFSGAEFYIDQKEFNPDGFCCMLPRGPYCCQAAAERWWRSQLASKTAKRSDYPLARIHHFHDGDKALKAYWETYNTFAGAEVAIRSFSLEISDSSDDEGFEWHLFCADNKL